MHPYIQLIRPTVSLAVTFSAFTAYIACKHSLTPDVILPVCGIFLLAAGASALNQVQERKTDAFMGRTFRRPLPSGRMPVSLAIIITSLLILAGLFVLYYSAGTTCLLLGLFNILWYNGLYTNLKRITPFAVVPGALTGAVPVLMGWSAAGGYITAPEAVFLGAFIFIWQVPHFWILLLRYDNEYLGAGLPVITSIFNYTQTSRIIRAWTFSSMVIPWMFYRFGLLKPGISPWILAMLTLMMVLLLLPVFRQRSQKPFRLSFIATNVYLVVVLLLIIWDNLFTA